MCGVLQLILSLTTNWGDTGSVDQYVAWSSTANSHDQFFSDADCMQLYKDFVKTVLGRVNTINGRTYALFRWFAAALGVVPVGTLAGALFLAITLALLASPS